MNDEPLFVFPQIGRRDLCWVKLLVVIGFRELLSEGLKIAQIVLDRQRTSLGMFEIFSKAIQHRRHGLPPLMCYTTSF